MSCAKAAVHERVGGCRGSRTGRRLDFVASRCGIDVSGDAAPEGAPAMHSGMPDLAQVLALEVEDLTAYILSLEDTIEP